MIKPTSISYTVDPKYELVKTKHYTIDNSVTYKVMNYEYDKTTDENAIYRSVVLTVPVWGEQSEEWGEHSEGICRLLAFSPPNSVDFAVFRNKYPEITADMYVNEVIEGTMINLFFDDRVGQWQIATRSSVGGDYWYYRNQYPGDIYTMYQPTFRQMFLDAVKCTTIHEFGESMKFLRNRSYCFVLQHPANHIVQNHYLSSIYLVAVYELRGLTAIHVPLSEYIQTVIYPVQIPRSIPVIGNQTQLSYTTLMEKILDESNQYSMNESMGYMILNTTTGERTMMANPKYEDLKELRGNHPNLQYQYLVLKKSGKVMRFLAEFPQYRNLFFRFYQQYSAFVTNVHNAYVSYYVKKSGEKIPKSIFIHVYKIHHEIFLRSNVNDSKCNVDELSTDSVTEKPSKMIVKRKVVDDYIANLEPSSLLYYLTHANKVDEPIV